jgi:hypothetical protein
MTKRPPSVRFYAVQYRVGDPVALHIAPSASVAPERVFVQMWYRPRTLQGKIGAIKVLYNKVSLDKVPGTVTINGLGAGYYELYLRLIPYAATDPKRPHLDGAIHSYSFLVA